MKSILIGGLFLFSFSAGASYELQSFQERPEVEFFEEIGDEAVSTDEVQLAQAAICRAFTACPRGGGIQCVTYGAGCTWYVTPYQSVSCTGYDGWGRWVNFFFTCY